MSSILTNKKLLFEAYLSILLSFSGETPMEIKSSTTENTQIAKLNSKPKRILESAECGKIISSNNVKSNPENRHKCDTSNAVNFVIAKTMSEHLEADLKQEQTLKHELDEVIFCDIDHHPATIQTEQIIPFKVEPIFPLKDEPVVRARTSEANTNLQNVPNSEEDIASGQKAESRNLEVVQSDFENDFSLIPEQCGGRGFETEDDLKVLALVTKEMFKALALKTDCCQLNQDRWFNPHLIADEY